jgi:hypothetical protein
VLPSMLRCSINLATKAAIDFGPLIHLGYESAAKRARGNRGED